MKSKLSLMGVLFLVFAFVLAGCGPTETAPLPGEEEPPGLEEPGTALPEEGVTPEAEEEPEATPVPEDEATPLPEDEATPAPEADVTPTVPAEAEPTAAPGLDAEMEGPDLTLLNLDDIDPEDLASYIATTTVTWVPGGADDPMNIDTEQAQVLVAEKRVVRNDDDLGVLGLDIDSTDLLQYAYVVATQGQDLEAASGTDAASSVLGSESLMPAEFVTVDGTTYARVAPNEWLQLVGSMASYVADTLDMQDMEELYNRVDLGNLLDDFWWDQGDLLGDDLNACMPAEGEDDYTVEGADDLTVTHYTCEYAVEDLGGRWDNFQTVTSDLWIAEDYVEDQDLVVRRFVVGETNEEFTVDTDYEGQTGTVIIESVLSEINGDVNMVIPAEVLDEISTIEGLEIMGVDGAAVPGAATTPEGATTPEAADGEGPSVTVEDQAIENNSVTIAEVMAEQAGWLVIHADDGGSPGPVLGWTAVEEGMNEDVVIELTEGEPTDTLHAMLHIDAGTEGEYEFPGPDGPAQDADGNVVNVPFAVDASM